MRTVLAMALLKFTWLLLLAFMSCYATDLEGCTPVRNVACKKGTATFELEQHITEKLSQCESGIYDKDDQLIVKEPLLENGRVAISKSCPSEFRLKMQCPDMMNNLVICYRVVNDASSDARNDAGNDAKNDQPNNGPSLLWLLASILVAIVIGL